MDTVKTFEHANEQYEVCTISTEDRTYVRVFKSGQPANGYEYAVGNLSQNDSKSSGRDILKELIGTAESDVREGIWDQYVAATSNRVELQVDYHPSGRRTLKQKVSGQNSWTDLQGELWSNNNRGAFYEAAFRYVANLINQGKVVVSLKDASPV